MTSSVCGFLLGLLAALGSTIVIELVFALLLGVRKKSGIITVITVNVITNPILNCTLQLLAIFAPGVGIWGPAAALEVAVVLFEGWFYKRVRLTDNISTIRAYLFSLVLNAASFTIGLLF